MNIAPLSKPDRIRVLNDNFRSTFVGGQVVMTQGVGKLPLDTKARVLLAVQSFSNFTKDNDPHGEHDFGSFELAGVRYFFKLDYYAPDMEGGSEDPADPKMTTRVLTIMRADEY
jgi:predicted glycosyltransferase involved in capsule biosynthesis